MKTNCDSKNFSAYIAALKTHKSKVAAGQRTNRVALWHKRREAIREMQAGPIVTQAECNEFFALTEAEAAK
jgi:hypothetical protein